MVKQISLLFLFFGLYAANAFPQAQVAPSTGTNLYERALSVCVTEQLKRYGVQSSETRVRLSNRIVEYDNIITAKLPTQFGVIKVEYLNKQEIIEHYKKTRADIPVTVIRPMKNDGTTLKINFSDYYVTYKKRVFNYALEGGCNVDIKFDSQLDGFVITKINLWGV